MTKSRNPRMKNEIDERVAQRLEAARRIAGMSQEKLAAALELTFQQVQKYGSGKNRITVGRLYQIAGILGKPVAWFFGDERTKDHDDEIVRMLATGHGADLARAFVDIESNLDRMRLTDIAVSLANNAKAKVPR